MFQARKAHAIRFLGELLRIRPRLIAILLIIPISFFIVFAPRAFPAPSSTGALYAILIQVTSYKGDLALREPYSIDQSVPVMRDAVEKFAQLAGYHQDNVFICEITEAENYSRQRPAFCQARSSDENKKPPRPEKPDIEHVLKAVRKVVTSETDDTFVFYFTGHGSSTGSDVQLYLANSNSTEKEVLGLNDILATLHDGTPIKARRKLFFFDNCQTRRRALTKTKLNVRDIGDYSKVGLFFSSNMTEDQSSYIDRHRRTGYFTRFLAQALEGEALPSDKDQLPNEVSLSASNLIAYLRAQIQIAMLTDYLHKDLELDVAEAQILGASRSSLNAAQLQVPDMHIPPPDTVAGKDFDIFTRKLVNPYSVSIVLGSDSMVSDLRKDIIRHINSNRRVNIPVNQKAKGIDVYTLPTNITDILGLPTLIQVKACGAEPKEVDDTDVSSYFSGVAGYSATDTILVAYLRQNRSTEIQGASKTTLVIYSCILRKTESKLSLTRLDDYIIHSIAGVERDAQSVIINFVDHLRTHLSPSTGVLLSISFPQYTDPYTPSLEYELCSEFSTHLQDQLNRGNLRSLGVFFHADSRWNTTICPSSTAEALDTLREIATEFNGYVFLNGGVTLEKHLMQAWVAPELIVTENETFRVWPISKKMVMEPLPLASRLVPTNALVKSEAFHLSRHLAHRLAKCTWTAMTNPVTDITSDCQGDFEAK